MSFRGWGWGAGGLRVGLWAHERRTYRQVLFYLWELKAALPESARPQMTKHQNTENKRCGSYTQTQYIAMDLGNVSFSFPTRKEGQKQAAFTWKAQ